MTLVLRLSPNKNNFTELVGILWTEFKVFDSNWKRFDLYFPLLKPKKWVRFFNESKSQSKFGLEVSSQGKLLHWGTGRYLMNWIQVVYFKRGEIWPLFAPPKAKKSARFLLPYHQTFEWKQISVQIWLEVCSSWNFIYRVKRTREEHIWNFIPLRSVVPEISLMANRAAKCQSHRIFSHFMKHSLFFCLLVLV